MGLKNRVFTGIVLICSLILSSCAFPVRPGYDRRSGSYKRYRVPKKEIVKADTATVNSQEELVQEEILAAASKNTSGASSETNSSQTSLQDSTVKREKAQTPNLALRDSSANKESTGQISKQDSAQTRNSDTTKTAGNTTAQSPSKPSEKTADKVVAKKSDKTAKKTTKPAAKPTNLEKYAKEWLGAKYVYGAASKRKTDCSGYVMQVYKGFYGISLDHSAQHIYDDGRGYSIKRKKLQEGDIVFFGNFWKISHVGIYLKGNRFIHASTSKGVVITPMDDNYWASKYKVARRFK